MKFIFDPFSPDDLVRLLKAWRFWMAGALLGALLGAAAYFIAPPPYRARAAVKVDLNVGQALPKDTTRKQFYYLERESRKLAELAWSDEVINRLSAQFAITNEDLRGSVLQLSQPAEAGWYFYADSADAKTAGEIASAWANAFVGKTQAEIAAGNANELIKLEIVQSKNLPKQRSIPLSGYLLAGSMGALVFTFVILFIKPK